MIVSDLVSATERHLLGGDRDELNRLTNTVSGDDLTFTFDFDLGSIDVGSYIAIELELVYVWSIDAGTKTATVQRAMLGTEATYHPGTTLAYVNPEFSKWEIFQALRQEVADMNAAGVFKVNTFTLTSSSVARTYEIPLIDTLSGITDILDLRWDNIGPEEEWPHISRRQFELLRAMPFDPFNITLLLRIDQCLPDDRTIKVSYSTGIAQPTAMYEDVGIMLGMNDYLTDIPPLGAAARLMGMREAQRSFIERTDSGRREVPPGSSARSAAVLMQMRNDRVRAEIMRLRRQWPVRD